MTARDTPPASSPEALARMRRQRRRDTAAERALRSELHRRGLRFRVDFKLPVPRRRADIAFPRQRVCVMVDGCFWHGCPQHGTRPKENAGWWRAKIDENRRRDKETNSLLLQAGWLVVRVWEHEDTAEAAEKIAAALRERRSGCYAARAPEPNA